MTAVAQPPWQLTAVTLTKSNSRGDGNLLQQNATTINCNSMEHCQHMDIDFWSPARCQLANTSSFDYLYDKSMGPVIALTTYHVVVFFVEVTLTFPGRGNPYWLVAIGGAPLLLWSENVRTTHSRSSFWRLAERNLRTHHLNITVLTPSECTRIYLHATMHWSPNGILRYLFRAHNSVQDPMCSPKSA